MPFKIVGVKVDRSGSVTPDEMFGGFELRDQAKQRVQLHIERFAHRGYDEQHDYWWGRDEGDAFVLRRFWIEPA